MKEMRTRKTPLLICKFNILGGVTLEGPLKQWFFAYAFFDCIGHLEYELFLLMVTSTLENLKIYSV